ncbi:hypothetical protein CEXT_630461 [Caerostris extrusa]|uniref:Uncharacterized protein n=1 Tax=Caerostris extrusa TaxID=172846 RepID=A0AAV4VA91_CAEEX|nr:hypothetical protein CEXT_630461 [Caerostris extrusa]
MACSLFSVQQNFKNENEKAAFWRGIKKSDLHILRAGTILLFILSWAPFQARVKSSQVILSKRKTIKCSRRFQYDVNGCVRRLFSGGERLFKKPFERTLDRVADTAPHGISESELCFMIMMHGDKIKELQNHLKKAVDRENWISHGVDLQLTKLADVIEAHKDVVKIEEEIQRLQQKVALVGSRC